MPESSYKKNLKYDIPAGIVVFLVALPLCLGIAQASGANPLAGVIAGIVGGVVIGSLSGSSLGVSGPAAGLATIVADNLLNIRIDKLKNLGYTDPELLHKVAPNVKDFDMLTKDIAKMDQILAMNGFHAFDYFLLAVLMAGVLQLALGYLKAGVIAAYFPTSVIKGMLAAIGIKLIITQIPHGVGYDMVSEGNDEFLTPDNHNIISEIFYSLKNLEWGAMIITFLSISILLFWQTKTIKKHKILSLIPAPLLVVILGIMINLLYKATLPNFTLSSTHLVRIPISESISEFSSIINTPDFSSLGWNYSEWKYVFSIAIIISFVASLETLLSVEATDKLDPQKRVTPTNRELKAQGVGNIISGLVGGLPITQVIVRSSANVNAGGKTKTSGIIHGFLLLLSLLLIPSLLNMIPLASLAAILIIIGYKLASFKLVKEMYSLEHRQFIPFIITIGAIFFTDLLKGVIIGLIVAIYYILKDNKGKEPYEVSAKYIDSKNSAMDFKITFYEEVHYLSKNTIKIALNDIPPNSTVLIDGTQSRYISQDVLDAVKEFTESKAKDRNITINFQIKEEIYNEIDSSLLENMKL